MRLNSEDGSSRMPVHDTRARCSATHEELAEKLFRPFAKKQKSFLDFDHNPSVRQSKCPDRSKILKFKKFLHVAWTLDENLNFRRHDVEAGIKLVVSKLNSVWKMTEPQQIAYIHTMTSRTMNICYHTKLAISNKASWTEKLPWLIDGAKDADADADDGENVDDTATNPDESQQAIVQVESDAEDVPTYFYGWSNSMCLAWRSKIGQKTRPKGDVIANSNPRKS